MTDNYETGFLVISCSGASSSGQAANELAVELNKSGFAKMVCLAGVGAGLDDCVEDAGRVRDLIVIDGCDKACSHKMLEKIGIKPVHTFCLTKMGVNCPVSDVDPELLSELRKKIKLLFGQSRADSKYAVCGCDTCVRE
ncbi:putative zinc-binding protein [Maridesulfovibrio hydrothermalis]|uniref:DGC domain protein n=1 Tax=Maridesulfovibrio hydrothermalis AM13 = DSM 14728 TaxID=1121451 RepID=L0RBC4_9BACT|nr:putative zinc-binding protein [Maridesulfovibrio hydrothermalis]CCO23470.1 DGC domain protein [Maridesulfovibrio hydrothermalis AM13 = DSM 14728]